jgi:transposase-like protein
MVEQIVVASKPQSLFEIRIGVRRRRRWSDKIKGQIVEESYAPGAMVSEVARRHGLSPQQLSAWRKAARTGALSLPVDTAPLFVPVMAEERHDDATPRVVPDSRGMSTPENNGSLSSCQARGSVRRPGPRHELIDTRGRPEIDQLGQHVGEIGLRVDTIQFAALDERRNTGPVLCPMIMAGEKRILAIQNERTNGSLDDVGVEFDAAVIEKPREPVPMVQGVADMLGDRRLGRDAPELLLEPGFEREHDGPAAFMAHRPALVGATAADRLLDCIELRDARKRLAGNRCVAGLGDVEEASPKVTLMSSST